MQIRDLQWHITWSVAAVAAIGLVLASPHPVQAKTFHCGAGEVTCLIDAMTEANANGKENTIKLDAGVYTLTEVNNTTDGQNGLPSLTSTLTIQGAGADTTILERVPFSVPGFRLVHVAVSGHLTLKGVTLSGGGESISFMNQPVGRGGGVFNQGGTVRVIRSVITRGFVSSFGGGIFSAGGTVRIIDSWVLRNFTNAGGGGGVFAAGGTVIIRQSAIAENGSAGGTGGGLSLTAAAVVTMVDSTVVENGAPGDEVGGILNQGSYLELTNSTVARNRGRWAGGLCTHGGVTVLLNSTLAENGAGPNTIPFCTGGTTTVQNTILSSFRDSSSPITSLGNNIISDPIGLTVTLQPTDLTGDPGLGPFTETAYAGEGYFPLQATSQAINAGNPRACPRTDQLRQLRHKPCDIGAIEFHEKIARSQ